MNTWTINQPSQKKYTVTTELNFGLAIIDMYHIDPMYV